MSTGPIVLGERASTTGGPPARASPEATSAARNRGGPTTWSAPGTRVRPGRAQPHRAAPPPLPPQRAEDDGCGGQRVERLSPAGEALQHGARQAERDARLGDEAHPQHAALRRRQRDGVARHPGCGQQRQQAHGVYHHRHRRGGGQRVHRDGAAGCCEEQQVDPGHELQQQVVQQGARPLAPLPGPVGGQPARGHAHQQRLRVQQGGGDEQGEAEQQDGCAEGGCATLSQPAGQHRGQKQATASAHHAAHLRTERGHEARTGKGAGRAR